MKEEGGNHTKRRLGKDKRKREGGDDSDDSADFELGLRPKKTSFTPKRRRVRYGWACSMCKIKHRSCDGQRPCHRCRNEGFADTCNDGPAYQEEDVYKGKEPNRQFSCRNEPVAVDLAVSHTKVSSCAYQQPQCHLIRQEQEIFAKVTHTVAMAAAASASAEPFLFQFLEPPSWHHTSVYQTATSPLHVPTFCNYLPPHFAFGPPFSSIHLDDEEEEEDTQDQNLMQGQVYSSPRIGGQVTHTSTDPFGPFLRGDFPGGLASQY